MPNHTSYLIISILVTAFIGATLTFYTTEQQYNPNVIEADILLSRMIPDHDDYWWDTLPEEGRKAIWKCTLDLLERWGPAYVNSTQDPPPDEEIRVAGQVIKIWGCPDAFISVKLGGGPDSIDEFREFIRRRITVLKILAADAPDHKLGAWVSPIKPLTSEEFDALISKHGLEVISTNFRYIRKDTGERVATGGGFGLLQPPEHRLKGIQEDLLPPGVEIDYRIVDFSVYSTAQSLLNLQNDPLILIVDVGPLDVLYQYARRGAYIFWSSPWRYSGPSILVAALVYNVDTYELREYVEGLLAGIEYIDWGTGAP